MAEKGFANKSVVVFDAHFDLATSTLQCIYTAARPHDQLLLSSIQAVVVHNTKEEATECIKND